jgi:nucleotide sugar dehydrogenase
MTKILNLSKESVAKALKQGDITISVTGLNQLGISLATIFAEKGAKVIGCDTNPNVVNLANKGETDIIERDITWLIKEENPKKAAAKIAQGICPNCRVILLNFQGDIFCPSCGRSMELDQYGIHVKGLSQQYKKAFEKSISLKELIKKNIEKNKFKATTDLFEAFLKSDVAIITVDAVVGPPPDYSPDFSALTEICETLGSALKKGDLVIMKGIVTPGTTEGLVKTILENKSRLKAGYHFGLVYMPEKTGEGNTLFQLKTSPKILGGVDQKSLNATAALFNVFPASIFFVSGIKVAETAKLIEGIYSDVSIAFANEIALACQKLGVDVIDVINMANMNHVNHIPFPSPVGGKNPHDSLFLFSFQTARLGYSPQLITWGHRVNEEMPHHILEMIKDTFNAMGVSIKGSNVSVLGVSPKADTASIENSPSFRVIETLIQDGAKVAVHAPYADLDLLGIHLREVTLITRNVKDALKDAQCAVIMVDHTEYKYLSPSDFAKKMKKGASIIDVKRILDPAKVIKAGLIYRGIGYPPIPA